MARRRPTSVRLKLVELLAPYGHAVPVADLADRIAALIEAAPASAYPDVPGWSEARLLRLERLWASGLAVKVIARHLNRFPEHVAKAAKKAGIALRWPRGSSGRPLYVPHPVEAPWPPAEIVLTQDVAGHRARISAGTKAGLDATLAPIGRKPKVTDRIRAVALLAIALGRAKKAAELRALLNLKKPTFHSNFPGGYGALRASASTELGHLPKLEGEWSESPDVRNWIAEGVRLGAGFGDLSKLLNAPNWQRVRAIALEEGACSKDVDGRPVLASSPFAVADAAHKPKERKCLCCRRAFTADGPGNHLCPRCRASAGYKVDLEAVYA